MLGANSAAGAGLEGGGPWAIPEGIWDQGRSCWDAFKGLRVGVYGLEGFLGLLGRGLGGTPVSATLHMVFLKPWSVWIAWSTVFLSYLFI